MDQQTILDPDSWLLWKNDDYNNKLFVERSMTPDVLKGNGFYYTEAYYVVRNGHVRFIGMDLSEDDAVDSLRRLRLDCECLGDYDPAKIPAVRFWQFDVTKFRTVLLGGALAMESAEEPKTVEPIAEKPALPTTLDEAVAYLLPRFEGLENYYPDQGEDDFASFCHSQLSGGIGMQIRNELQLWVHESPLHQYFLAEHNLFHPDEMSDLIIRHIYRKRQPATDQV